MKVHDDAFLALIRSDAGLATATFEGTVKGGPSRYLSVFARDTRDANRYTGPQNWVESEYVVHSVALDVAGAKSAREHMLAKTLDVVPDISGWKCGRIRFVTSQPMGVDRDVDPAKPLYYFVDVLAFSSQPA